MDDRVKVRLAWISLYKELGNAGEVCKQYGISRLTLRKWFRRYEAEGEKGLIAISSRPINSPLRKRKDTDEQLILQLRRERKLGARRLQNELKRLYSISFSTATIHKILKKHKVAPLKIKRYYRKQCKRYNRKIPGERLQMDVCKIRYKLYRYTAIDDCTRYKVIALYTRRTAINTLNFLDQVIERMPFYPQAMQTDRGQEFFAYTVQERLRELKIRFRPIKPFSPYLNGKVERTQRTDLDEFYSSISLDDPELATKLKSWEEYYNTQRSHSSLGGKTPWEKYQELKDKVPALKEIQEQYDSKDEPCAIQNYKYDRQIKLIYEFKKKEKN